MWFGDTRAAFLRAERRKRLRAFQTKTTRGSWREDYNGKLLQDIVDDEPELYLDEIQEQFVKRTGELWSISSLYTKLHSPAINYSLRVATDTATQQQEQLIQDYFDDLKMWMVDPSQLIFIDESAKDRNSSRRHHF